MSPVYDADLPPRQPDAMDALMLGFTRIRDPDLLRRVGARWAEEIRHSGRREEVELAYRNRMKQLTR
jgi:hypothetical protein